MSCPKCNKRIYCKDGLIKGKQRYLCKSCNYRWTVIKRSTEADTLVKRKALELYLEGLGFRAIGRILGFSNVSILNWIRDFGKQITKVKSNKLVKVVEIDEMHSYISSKKMLVGSGLLLIDMEKDLSMLLLDQGG